MMTTATDTNIDRMATLHATLGSDVPELVGKIRAAGIARFRERGFPTTKQEEWIYTNVAPIAKTPFRLAGARQGLLDRAQLAGLTLDDEAAVELVFVNGHYIERLSRTNEPTSVTVRGLGEMIRERPDAIAPHFGTVNGTGAEFPSLNAAFLEDGAFIHIPDGFVQDKPIHVLFVATRMPFPQMISPRVIIVAGASSESKIVETFAGLDEANYLTNHVSEIVLEDNARLDHTRVQTESEHAFNISLTAVHQKRNSHFFSHAIHLGGGIVRNEIRATLDGEGSECLLDGLYVLAGSQHVDNHTVIDHAQPHATSQELYKGILDGRSRGAFNGKIIVRKDAQKTLSRQTNNNLLLTSDAIADSKPQLEIYADDVKCNHGSTIGQLDQESLFYHRSRGIGATEARNILTFAFGAEITGRLKVETVRARIEKLLLERLPAGAGDKEAS
jgi:Fe-S cluster assembly protein SufD